MNVKTTRPTEIDLVPLAVTGLTIAALVAHSFRDLAVAVLLSVFKAKIEWRTRS